MLEPKGKFFCATDTYRVSTLGADKNFVPLSDTEVTALTKSQKVARGKLQQKLKTASKRKKNQILAAIQSINLFLANVNACTIKAIVQPKSAVGSFHACAFDARGKLKCWGSKVFTGVNGSGGVTSSPISVSGTDTFKTVAAGTSGTCGITTSGAAKCWGQNDVGFVGDGSQIYRRIPTQVSGITSGATGIAAGRAHACAIVSSPPDRTGIKCWGRNGEKQLGDSNATFSAVPVSVQQAFDLSTIFTSISAGDYHTCSLEQTGKVFCWGLNVNGELGVAPPNDSDIYSPWEEVSALPQATSVACGSGHTCAVTAVGSVECWGSLTTEMFNFQNLDPLNLSSLSGVVSVASGNDFSCALNNSGAVYCWGAGDQGQLGNGNTEDSYIPVSVVGLTSGVTHISAGGSTACAVKNDQQIYCWGRGGSGQIGNGGKSINASTPQLVKGSPW